MSASSSAGTSLPSTPERSSATSAAVFSIAGAMICTGCSPASWRMYSPRSVSTGLIPACSSASLSRISSLAIDFDLATSLAPARRQTSTICEVASSAVRQKRTWPPSPSTAWVNSPRYRSRSAIVRVRISRPRSRSSSISGTSSQVRRRAVMNRSVAESSASWACASASFSRATARKRAGGCASSVMRRGRARWRGGQRAGRRCARRARAGA